MEVKKFVRLKYKWETKKAKDVTYHLNHHSYVRVFVTKSQKGNTRLHKKNTHKLHAQATEKIGLSCYDYKRYILQDGVTSLAYLNYSVR